MAHVYNVLREKGLLSSDWADIEFLLIHGGIEALFQGVRPTTRERGRFAARLLHACGIREADFNTHFDGIKHGFFERRKLGITLVQGPLNELLFNRAMQTFERPKNCTHLEGVHIKNRKALWKFKDKGPELPPIELLAVIRRGLEDENQIYQFGHFKFEKVCSVLVQALVVAWQEEGYSGSSRVTSLETKLDSGGRGITEATVLDTARQITYQILELGKSYHQSASKEMYIRGLQAAANVFEKWLAVNGSVGIKGTRRPGPPKHVSILKPDVYHNLKRVVEKHGILDGVFEAEQIEGLEWLKPTITLENMIRNLWANHRDRTKTSKPLEQSTKTDEAADVGEIEDAGQT